MRNLEELKKSLVKIIDSEIKKFEQEQAKPAFEVGKWYKENNGRKMWFIKSLDGRDQMSFGFNADGIWTDLEQRHSIPSEFHVATPTEIQEALEKEAVKRGFKAGYQVCGLWDKLNPFIGSVGHGYYYIAECDIFGLNNTAMYCQGKWATVIKEQPLMIGGKYEIKFYPTYITINACAYTKTDVEQMYHVLKMEQIRSLNVGCSGQYQVNIELITEILDRLK